MLQALGAQVRARRKALRVTATAAAESAGISRVTWYRIEKGEPSVAAGAYASAAAVLDLEWALADRNEPRTPGPDVAAGWLPVRIPLADYPQLRKLAWHAQGTDELTPREALSIYERNARHLDETELSTRERALIDALRTALVPDV
ncbi:helix-turn-helix transcriptional regulator [Luteimonas dalianensis]|uniref:helix-turn-helix transcriptional regulator n=1 Tax=Luteimonas dalianensis TaxID=1148196 RepID=UPI003BF41AD2